MTDTERFGLSKSIVSDLLDLFGRHTWIDKVLIFGSRAKGYYRSGSDIDLAVFGLCTDQEFTELWGQIDDLPIVFKIDLLNFDSLCNQTLREKILKEGVAFYARPPHHSP